MLIFSVSSSSEVCAEEFSSVANTIKQGFDMMHVVFIAISWELG